MPSPKISPSSTHFQQVMSKGSSNLHFEWPFPDFRKPHTLWKLKSRYCVLLVGISVGKIALSFMNSFKMRNRETLVNAVFNRPKGVPLITVSNHESCMDDPALMASFMNIRQLGDQDKMRWSLAAHDICFRRPFYSSFFAHGKCIPTVRGLGVYQKAVDFAIDRLDNYGDWLHIFPEGKVNMERKHLMRLKWGVGRIISELDNTPIVLPFWHTGMSDVLPNHPPYIPRIGKKVFMNVGQPLDMAPVIKSVEGKSAIEKRKIITDFIQGEMDILRQETLKLAKSQ